MSYNFMARHYVRNRSSRKSSSIRAIEQNGHIWFKLNSWMMQIWTVRTTNHVSHAYTLYKSSVVITQMVKQGMSMTFLRKTRLLNYL